MAKRHSWSDDYWLLLMQLYLKKPVGLKPLYSRGMVALSLELHLPPQVLYEQMFRLRQLETPQIEQLWQKYGKSPRKLQREVELLRRMNGFGQSQKFYEGVEVNESFEPDFKPLEADTSLMPVSLILILDLYFRLTPITMVAGTPEVVELAKLLNVSADKVADVMDVFRFCDPYLNRADLMIHPLLPACQDVWQRFGNDNPEKLAALAAQLKEYFK
ncbi:MAG TPA: hypothetical protein VIQ97_01540 [Prevotella sp.]